MKTKVSIALLIISIFILFTHCSQSQDSNKPLYLILYWHQHQPSYYDAEKGFQSAENKVPNIPQNVNELKIGFDTVQDSRYFKGLIDDVRIYNYALSQEEVKLLTLKQTASL